MATELNRVRYAGLDFSTHEDELLARLQVKYASVYNDFVVSSLGIMLIDVFSYGLDTLSFYLDRRATDLYLSTARTRKSVARAARQLGYKMAPAVASSVDVSIRPSQAYDFAITLPVGFQLLGPNSLIFESRQEYTWPIGSTAEQVITFSECETIVTVFTSTGDPNQSFEIRNVPTGKFIVGPGTDGVSQVKCEVAGATWTESELLQFGETNQFEIGYNDSPPTLRLGDGIAGNIPEAGAEIRLTYFASSGVSGQAKAGTITKEVAPLVVNFVSIELIINNETGSSGGSDPETLEKAKAFAPQVFKSRGVNITAEDYEARAGSFVDSVYGAVAVAKAITVRSAQSDVYLNKLLNDLRGVSDDYVNAVSAGQTSISTFLDQAAEQIDEAQETDEDLETEISAVQTDARAAASSGRSASTGVEVIIGYANDAQWHADHAAAPPDPGGVLQQLEAIAESGDETNEWLSEATKDALITGVTKLKAYAANIGVKALGVLSDADTAATKAQSAFERGAACEDYRSTIRTAVDGAETNIGTVSPRAGARGALLDMVDAVDGVENTITALADEIYVHVDSFLASDCQSNLIEVPVLTLDSEGFYALPTISLIKSLQAALDKKKEVTQVVKVVAAEDVLVPADILAHVGVLPGYVEGTIRSQVESQILSVLRGRRFGASLQLSELYWVVVTPSRSDIEGVDFVTVKITAPADKLDSDGNLVVDESEVVTRGTITVTSEVVSA